MTTDEPVPTAAPASADEPMAGVPRDVPPPPDAPLPPPAPRTDVATPHGSAPTAPLPPAPAQATPAAAGHDHAGGTSAASAPVPPAAPVFGGPAPHGVPIPTAPHGVPGAAAPHGTPPPAAYGTPAPDAPAYGAPGYGAPSHGAPGFGAPGSPSPYLAPGAGHPGGFPPAGRQPAGKGMAITALVLAGVALLLSWVPLVNYLAGVLAVAGLVVGVVALVQARPGRGMAIAGVVVAVVSVGMVLASHAVYARVFTEFAEGFAEGMAAPDDPVPFDEPPFDEPPTDPSPDALAPDEPADGTPAADLTVAFGETFLYEDGLEVTVAAPAPYQPSPYASGVGATGEHVRFAVTVTNNTAEEYQPVLFLTSVTSGGAPATEIHDYGSDLTRAPLEPVQPGQGVTFEVAYTITDPASVVMEVQASVITHEPFTVTPG